MSIKRNISLFLSKIKYFKLFYFILKKLNLIIFHWNERSHYLIYNKNAEKKYYIIRSRGNTEGLLSSVYYVLGEIKWAKNTGYIPYVDFSNSLCQYYVGREINGTMNAWEYYFLQPEIQNVEDINKKHNTILLSGWRLCERKSNDFTNIKLHFQPYILEIVNSFFDKEFKDKIILGVFIRGTDYVSLKPKGHPIQPSISDVKNKIQEFMTKYKFHKIYLVTEDYSYYEYLNYAFPNLIFSYGDNYIKDYNGKDFISNSFNNDAYERGLIYLIRIILLSKCEYVISSKASGSLFANLIRQNNAIDNYMFDLGIY